MQNTMWCAYQHTPKKRPHFLFTTNQKENFFLHQLFFFLEYQTVVINLTISSFFFFLNFECFSFCILFLIQQKNKFFFCNIFVCIWKKQQKKTCLFFDSISYYYEFSKEQDYICSKPVDSGMHMCSNLPPYRIGPMVCNGKCVNDNNCLLNIKLQFIRDILRGKSCFIFGGGMANFKLATRMKPWIEEQQPK